MAIHSQAVTWKQTLIETVISHVNSKGDLKFQLQDVYDRIDVFRAKFPENRHVEEKIRQTLQRLRDESFVVFEGKGRYRINESNVEFNFEPVVELPQGRQQVIRKRAPRLVSLRDTVLAMEIKKQYCYKCQVCGNAILLSNEILYAEAHHLRPIGNPHNGPDIPGNIIVLCPNHHVMFDRGAIAVHPRTLKVSYATDSRKHSAERLFVARWHKLQFKFVAYHYKEIFRKKIA